MTPTRNLDHTVGREPGRLARVWMEKEPVVFCFPYRNALRAAHLLECFGEGLRVVHVEQDDVPFVGESLELARSSVRRASFDRQQLDARRLQRIPLQLG